MAPAAREDAVVPARAWVTCPAGYLARPWNLGCIALGSAVWARGRDRIISAYINSYAGAGDGRMDVRGPRPAGGPAAGAAGRRRAHTNTNCACAGALLRRGMRCTGAAQRAALDMSYYTRSSRVH